jgi:urea transport system substrate-binding protein
MTHRLGRRKFLLYGTAALGSSILLKACTEANVPETTDAATPEAGGGVDTIKVGILHSLSGTMAISEQSVVDAEQLAIEEINNAGGVLGKKIEAIVEDGASDWPTFAEKARKLIDQDKVTTVFGCWTSASRVVICYGIPCNMKGKNVLRTFFIPGRPPINR